MEKRAVNRLWGNAVKTLTNAFSATNTSEAVSVGSSYQLELDIAYTSGAGEATPVLELQIDDCTPDPNGQQPATTDTYFTDTTVSSSLGVTTHYQEVHKYTHVGAATTTDNINFKIPVTSAWVRVKIRESGVNNNYGTVVIDAITTESFAGN